VLDFGSPGRDYADCHQGIKQEILRAVNRGYRPITGEGMG
jgi:hypothetical protein